MVDIEKLEREKGACCGCSACASVCPNGCIEMRADGEGFLYPYVDSVKCIRCGLCEQVCPILCSTSDANVHAPEGYAVINKDENVRLKSSSGGVFSILAESIIRDGGIVFGAAMSEDCRAVFHVGVDSQLELAKLRGSKYVQSSIGDVYIQVRDALTKGRKVLFTGTPCQVEGLHSFLRREYENLLCMDFICHGVPSPKVWRKYVSFRENSAGSTVRYAFFRNKKYGWKEYVVLFEFTNNTTYFRIHRDDLYMKAFLQDCCLRPSCHDCHFKKLNRISDITVGDYWGIYNQYPSMDDDKGTSLVMVHTEKGKGMLDNISLAAKVIPIDVMKALAANRFMTESPCINEAREDFMSNLDKMDFDKLVRKYVKEPTNVKNIIKWILRTMNIETCVRRIFRI